MPPEDVSSTQAAIAITLTHMFLCFSSSLTRFKYYSLFFSFILFLLSGPPERQNPQDSKFYFFRLLINWFRLLVDI